MNNHRRLASNLGALYVVQGMQYLFPLLVIPVLTRSLGPAQFGTLAFWQSLAMGVSLIIDYGFGYSSVRAINQTECPDKRADIFWSTMAAKATLLVPATFILGTAALATGHTRDLLLPACAWITLLGTAASPAWYFIAIRKNVPVAILSVVGSALALAFMVVLVKSPQDFHAAAAIQFGMPFVTSAMMCAYLMRRAHPGRARLSAQTCYTRLREGLPLFAVSISAGAYSAFNPFLLGLVSSPGQVGAFSLSERLSRTARNAVSPILTAMYPYAAAAAHKSKRGDLRLRVAAAAAMLLSIAMAIVLAILAPLAVGLIAGPEYLAAVDVTRLLAINIALVTGSHLVGVQYLISHGREASVTAVTVVSAPVHIAIFLLAGYSYGALGGAAAYVATEGLVTFAFIFIALRHRSSV